ncbi:hypothetical protein BJ742DRAFT_431862 [Cladochytrium replicatum]|nr:hypothetical protein BJ742DRAFT_431862 [Cladochytrium replicatum]
MPAVSTALAAVPPMSGAEKEVDSLFQKHPVVELRSMEKKIRKNIDEKKQDLRLMVGERYRDLIDAADSIMSMRVSTTHIQTLFDTMQEACDVQVLKEEVEAQARRGKDNEVEERKKLLYPVAGQIKLLVDTPEQIWHSLEQHQYLRASRLYLIAKLVVKNLQNSTEASALKVPVSFPVVQRQWEAVSHFRAQVSQRAAVYLKNIDAPEQSLAETLCSTLLLANTTPTEALLQFLAMRKAAIVEALDSSTSSKQSGFPAMRRVASKAESNVDDDDDNSSALVRLLEAVKVIVVTLHHTSVLFLRIPSNRVPSVGFSPETEERLPPSLIEQCISSLETRPDAPTPNARSPTPTGPSTTSHSFLADLYSDKTNVHLIFRHLPSNIRTYVPHINTGRIASSPVLLQRTVVQKHVKTWLTSLGVLNSAEHLPVGQLGEVGRLAYDVLRKRVRKGTELCGVRDAVLQLVAELEAGGYVVSHSAAGRTGSFSTTHDVAVASGLKGLSAGRRGSSGTTEELTYSNMCTLLDIEFSAWNHLLRDVFFHRARDIVVEAFSRLTRKSEDKLKELSSKISDNTAGLDISAYVWSIHAQEINRSALAAPHNSTKAANLAGRWQPPAISILGELFEEAFVTLIQDVRPLVFSNPFEEKGETPATAGDSLAWGQAYVQKYKLDSDAAVLHSCMQEQCFEAMKFFQEHLLSLFQTPEESQSSLAVEKALVVGRFARVIAQKCSLLVSLFSPFPSSTGQQRSTWASRSGVGISTSSLSSTGSVTDLTTPMSALWRTGSSSSNLGGRMSTTKAEDIDPRLAQIQKLLMQVYLSAHRLWSTSLADKFSAVLKKQLGSVQWRVDAKGIWEEMTVDVANEAGELLQEKVKLPVHVSAFVMRALLSLVKGVNKGAGHTLEKPALLDLIHCLSERIITAYNDVLSGGANVEPWSAGGAGMQLLFDFKFLERLLEPSWRAMGLSKAWNEHRGFSDDTGDLFAQRAGDVVKSIKAEIDPIDLALLEGPLLASVERFYARTSVLFGLLIVTQSGDAIQEAKRNPTHEENHMVVAVAPQPPRFGMLPVAHPTFGGNMPSSSERHPDARYGDGYARSTPAPKKRSRPQITVRVDRGAAAAAAAAAARDGSKPGVRVVHPASPASGHTSTGAAASGSWTAALPTAQAGQKASEILMNASSFLQGVWAAGSSSSSPSPTLPRSKQGKQ